MKFSLNTSLNSFIKAKKEDEHKSKEFEQGDKNKIEPGNSKFGHSHKYSAHSGDTVDIKNVSFEHNSSKIEQHKENARLKSANREAKGANNISNSIKNSDGDVIELSKESQIVSTSTSIASPTVSENIAEPITEPTSSPVASPTDSEIAPSEPAPTSSSVEYTTVSNTFSLGGIGSLSDLSSYYYSAPAPEPVVIEAVPVPEAEVVPVPEAEPAVVTAVPVPEAEIQEISPEVAEEDKCSQHGHIQSNYKNYKSCLSHQNNGAGISQERFIKDDTKNNHRNESKKIYI